MPLWLALAAMWALPVAEAAEGAFTATGAVDVMGARSLEAEGLDVFLADTADLEAIEISAPRVVVHRFEWRSVPAANFEFVTAKEGAVYELTDVRARLLAADGGGWLGVYDLGAGHFGTLLAGAVSATPQARSSLGQDSIVPEPTPQPGRNAFAPAHEVPRLTAQVGGELRLEGRFAMKFGGVGLVMEASENQTVLDTREPSPGVERVRRWAYIELDDAKLTLLASEPLGATCGALRARGAELLAFRPTEGALHAGLTTYEGTGERVEVVGDLETLVVPVMRGTSAAATLEIAGDVHATTMNGSIRVPGSSAGAWFGILVGIAAAIAGGGVLMYAARRSSSSQLTLDAEVERADSAAAAGKFAIALEWTDRALLRAPQHPRLLCDRAFYLQQTGDVAGAVAAYERAAEFGSDGEAEMLHARLRASLGEDDAAESCAIGAMRKHPPYLFDVEDDPAFVRLRSRPRLAAAMAAARRDLGE